MGRYRTAELDEEIRRLIGDDEDEARRLARNTGKLGMHSDHRPRDEGAEDEGLEAVYGCRTCGEENAVTPPKGHRFARVRPDEADAGPVDPGPMLEFTCERCGAENRVQAPPGFKVMVGEARRRPRRHAGAAEGDGAHVQDDCESCGHRNRFRTPEGYRLVDADEDEGARRARVGESARRGPRPLSTREIDKILRDAYADPATLAIEHAAAEREALVAQVWSAHNAPLREGRRPSAAAEEIICRHFPGSGR